MRVIVSKTRFTPALLFFLLIIINLSCTREKGRIPYINFVLIMADDLGYSDLSCYGNTRFQTPNIDRLAKEGMLFTNYHSNGTVCSPARAALLTGRYQQKSGIEGVVNVGKYRHTGLPLNEITVAEILKKHGYKTGITGKWHLGYDTLYNPLNQGFDYFTGYVSGNIDYISHVDQAGYPDWWNGKDTLFQPGYSTDLITAHSIEFLKNNRNHPFFLYIAHEAPHYPYQGRNDRADRYPGKQAPPLGSREDRETAYREMIQIMDEGIGQVMKTLDNLDLSKNTLVFFCSDNGANAYGSNAPLMGYKGDLFEGGIRVPAIAWFPGIIKPSSRNNNPLMSMDLLPTFLSMAELPKPDEVSFDGIDASPAILFGESLPARPLFWRFGSKKSVILNSWKLIIHDTDTFLFDLKNDFTEQNNLLNHSAEEKNQLLENLREWEQEINKFTLLTK